jgi:(E)-4-hydroxy-3-methylbut-2-enyl-diphosphate synthase
MNIKEVSIGNIKMGNSLPILLQSMTSTSTMDTQATAEQVIRIANAGADLVRITAQNTKEAHHLAIIQEELKKRNYYIPLIADIHFNPKAAEVAATIVDKVRINPGNYVDKRKDKTDWTDEEYQEELKNISRKLKSLVTICKKHHTAIRVGVNHGSLSERIKNKYGDTIKGMAESAMEFIRIFQDLDFSNLVISLKASNVLIMVDANRLLYKMMKAENCVYPLHLGVTEAGDAEDGRIKSALGIGTLLAENIGDTIRVSLTEEPEFEIPVAKTIVKAAQDNPLKRQNSLQPFNRRESYAVGLIGNKQVPVIIEGGSVQNSTELQADYYQAMNGKTWISKNHEIIKECTIDDLINSDQKTLQNYYVKISPDDWSKELEESLKNIHRAVIVLEKSEATSVQEIQVLLNRIETLQIACPLILHIYSQKKDLDELMIYSTIQAGSFLLAGRIDGLWIDSSIHHTAEIAFGILQASRQRIFKTDYIACPSCGRTLFNIQEKLQEIKKQTQQFKGLKIGIMGCIVNGPGEMADADYGYVGAGPKKVDIYKAHKIIKKGVPEEQATQSLLDIINDDLA